jgi:hypothetical protein
MWVTTKYCPNADYLQRRNTAEMKKKKRGGKTPQTHTHTPPHPHTHNFSDVKSYSPSSDNLDKRASRSATTISLLGFKPLFCPESKANFVSRVGKEPPLRKKKKSPK